MYGVEDLRESPEFGSVPDWFWDQIPTECPECGDELVIQLNLTNLQCSNPHCPMKIAQRTISMIKDLGITGLGESGVTKIVNEYTLQNPIDLISGIPDLTQEIYEGINDSLNDRLMASFTEVKNRGQYVHEAVALMHLPNLGTRRSKDLFKGIETMDDLEGFLESCAIPDSGEELIRSQLGIGNVNDVTTTVTLIKDTLAIYQDDILDGLSGLNLISEKTLADGVQKFQGVYTDKVATDLAKTKKDFYRYVESNIPEVSIDWGSSVTKDIDFVITGTGDLTNKLKKAEKYGIRVLTEEEFFDWIHDRIDYPDEVVL